MRPKISVCRKRDNVYLKLMGNFNTTSPGELLHALKKLVLASLEFSHPGSEVCFTFKTHARVSLVRDPGAGPLALVPPQPGKKPDGPWTGRTRP